MPTKPVNTRMQLPVDKLKRQIDSMQLTDLITFSRRMTKPIANQLAKLKRFEKTL